MMKNKKPAVRFKGFSEDWEEKTLGEVSDSFGYGLNSAAKEYDGINKYIRITDIDEDSRNFIIDGLTSPDTDLNVAENYQLKLGDILFARTGANVGKTYIYKEEDGLVYFAGFLIRGRFKKDVNTIFIFQNTLTLEYEKFIRLTSQRSGQPGINAQEYSSFSLKLPHFQEQTQIGNFFKNLDNLITLHQQKYDKLVVLKKAMLEKMFPRNGAAVPEIRFKGFSGDWVERKLDNIADVRDGTHDSPQYIPRGRPFVTSKNVKDGYINFEDVQYISEADFVSINKRSKVDINDILMGMIGTIGNIALVREEPNFAIKNVALIKDTTNVYYLYLYYFLQSPIVLRQLEEGMDGGTQKFIALNKVRNLAVSKPTLPEQTKIGNYFKNIDHLLTLRQGELEKLKNLKKALLEKMFV
jgi:type I restriction enzyme, S subunit